MKKLKPIFSTDPQPDRQPGSAPADTEPFGKFRLGGGSLFYDGVFRVQYVPLDELVWVYLRREDALASVGCRRVKTLETFLVLVHVSGARKKLPGDEPEEMRALLERLEALCPEIRIGYRPEHVAVLGE